MNVLITGANGFLGKNLIEKLVKIENINIMHFDLGVSDSLLRKNLNECHFIFHFAAIHRPKYVNEFYENNYEFLKYLLNILKESKNKCPILFTSSIQSQDNTDYGRSKKLAEDELKLYSYEEKTKVIIYKLLNVFGKFAAPNHHSVVATFCYNTINDLPITISNKELIMKFYYIDDVIESFIYQLNCNDNRPEANYCFLNNEDIYSISLGDLGKLISSFRSNEKGNIPIMLKSDLEEKIYKTYNSYKNYKI
jgi:UDP-2-acetamido-2,6-beta-L-arabino-hexul-4-ose reductase